MTDTDADEDFSRNPPSFLARPTSSTRYLLYARAFAFASAVRLTLPDALRDDWLAPTLLHWVGAFILALNGALLGWLLCALGISIPLFFLADQLTQPVFLLGCALGAIGCWVGPASGRNRRMALGLPFVVRPLTVGTYFVAAIHKLNRDFFNPEVSCASGGVRLLGEDWGVASLTSLSSWPGWPWLFVFAELSLVVMLILRPAAGFLLGLFVHLPLTIVFAPAFAFTMMSGWVMLLREEDIHHLGRTFVRRYRWVVPLGSIAAVTSVSRYPAERWRTDPDWCLKEALLWIALAWVFAAWIERRPRGVFDWFAAWSERPPKAPRWIGVGLGTAWMVNGFMPYTGLQFQHSAAMLSNLRIDSGCWNSLVFPEALRLRDAYVRIDRASIGPAPGRPELEGQVTGILWNTESLRSARERWCRSLPQPIAIAGSFEGGSFVVADFCEPEGWRFGQSALPRYRAFQVNLSRECPQACVH